MNNGLLTEKQRIASIDIMRGIVMVIMALDHTRDFFHIDALAYDPANLSRTNPALFFTRWITHFCAPTFVLLAGTAINLSGQRKTKKELSAFLLTRGLWLIALEVVVVRFSFFFNFYYDLTVFQVIWAIGASMIIMSALIFLSARLILVLSVLITVGHNLLDGIQLKPGEPGFWPWLYLYQNGFAEAFKGVFVFVNYPVLPWLGIMLLGYCLGTWYQAGFGAAKRQKHLLYTGLGAIGLFIILRFPNLYGDPNPWSPQKNAIFTMMSFINCTKYPVSLLYILMTLGPVLIILSQLERIRINFLTPFIHFGRVPLFYYILHFFLIHAAALAFFMIKTGKSFSELDFHFANGFGGITSEGGYSLAWVYFAWICIVLFLYPLCKWYNNYKSVRREWWLSYV